MKNETNNDDVGQINAQDPNSNTSNSENSTYAKIMDEYELC
jgi:hypothetical protein